MLSYALIVRTRTRLPLNAPLTPSVEGPPSAPSFSLRDLRVLSVSALYSSYPFASLGTSAKPNSSILELIPQSGVRLCFHTITTVKFHNFFLLIFIQNARGIPLLTRRSKRDYSGRAGDGPIYPLSFLHLTAIPPQRAQLNPFGINPLRTLFVATEGVPPSLYCEEPEHRSEDWPLPKLLVGIFFGRGFASWFAFGAGEGVF